MTASTNILDGFDPLATSESEHDAVRRIYADAQKRDILNILRSYTGTLDVFSEAIQNAIDAVEQRSTLDGAAYTPRIWITIDMKNSLLRFVDNGVGMSSEEIRFFLRPNVTFKGNQSLRGHKGVGATFLAYGYSSFSVHTRQTHFEIGATLNGGRQWAENVTGHIPSPKFTGTDFSVPELMHEPSGTCIEVVLGSHRDERPRLSWLNILEPEIWHKVLRLRTPLGGIYLKTGGIKPAYSITVIDSQGASRRYEAGANGSEFYYPHEFSACTRHQDVNEITKKIYELGITRKDIAQKLPADFRHLDCIWNIWSKDTLIDEDGPFREDFQDDQLGLISQHDVYVYGCFVRSRTVWETFQQDELKIRPQYKVISGGLQLASDYMVQGDISTIPLTTAAGYQANSFIIVHFTNGNPDMGRKVFQPELKDIADILSRRVVAEIRRYQALLKPDTGSVFTNPSKALEEWRDDQRDWSKKSPMRLVIDGKQLALMSKPREEQDVIALFHELVGMNIIRGLNFYGTGYNTRHDGLFLYRYDKTHIYQKDSNFWGIDPNIVNFVPTESGALVLEYKYSFESLLTDFEKDEKNPKEINLVVCWEMGVDQKKMFDISSYLIGQEGGTRETFGATHGVFIGSGKSTKAFEVVCLSDFIEYYIDRADVISRHETIY